MADTKPMDTLVRAAEKQQGAKDIAGKLTTTRHSTHGDWQQQSGCARQLKEVISFGAGENGLSASQHEALDMIAVKISRILTGNPNEPDHWDDIMGYAKLGKEGHG
jgi:hypothetical protein